MVNIWSIVIIYSYIWFMYIVNVGKTMPYTTHDWEWFIPFIKMVMTGGH